MNNYLTLDAINKLKEEVEYKKVVVRRKINEDLKEARAQGDLSENAEYKAAKGDRARNEGRIRYLERMIKTAKIIQDTAEENEVGLNKKVFLRFLAEDEVEEFTIVTTIDADPINNMISIECPLGKAIYKHKVGDEITVNSPEGEYCVRIDKIAH